MTNPAFIFTSFNELTKFKKVIIEDEFNLLKLLTVPA